MSMPTPQTSLEQLVVCTRELIYNIINCNAETDEIQKMINTVKALNTQLQYLPTGKCLPHYNIAMAKTDCNYTLPFSPICGPLNPVASPLLLHYNEAKQEVYGTVSCNNIYEGPMQCIHGGVIASFYDQLLAMLSSSLGIPSFTAYLHIDYKKPTPLYQTLHLRAWVDKIEGRKITIKGECTLDDDILTCAEGLFIQQKNTSL